MFNKQYYQNKLIVLNQRLQVKKTTALNEILQVLQRYTGEQENIITDSQEIQKTIKENETGLVDKEGNPVKSKVEPSPPKKEEPKKKK